jgi:hypothetical protein
MTWMLAVVRTERDTKRGQVRGREIRSERRGVSVAADRQEVMAWT